MNNKEWLISDLHFGHANIIKYCDRPFKNVAEMDEILINNWNSVVKDGHVVYVLGDFSFYNKEKTTDIISRLNGEKYLILGNHDRWRSVKWWLECGFDYASKYPIIVDDYILCHEPIIVEDFKVIHGHIHNIPQTTQYTNIANVSCEVINYKPINFELIKGCLV